MNRIISLIKEDFPHINAISINQHGESEMNKPHPENNAIIRNSISLLKETL